MPKEDENHLIGEIDEDVVLTHLDSITIADQLAVADNVFVRFLESESTEDGEELDRRLNEVFDRFGKWLKKYNVGEGESVKSEGTDESGIEHSLRVRAPSSSIPRFGSDMPAVNHPAEISERSGTIGNGLSRGTTYLDGRAGSYPALIQGPAREIRHLSGQTHSFSEVLYVVSKPQGDEAVKRHGNVYPHGAQPTVDPVTNALRLMDVLEKRGVTHRSTGSGWKKVPAKAA